MSDSEPKIPKIKTGRVDMRRGKVFDIDFLPTEGLVGAKDFVKKHITHVEFDLKEYNIYRQTKKKQIDEELFQNCTTFSEITLFRTIQPKISRNTAMVNILESGIRVISTVRGREELTIQDFHNRQTGKWDLIMTNRNAFFEMSGINGKKILQTLDLYFLKMMRSKLSLKRMGKWI